MKLEKLDITVQYPLKKDLLETNQFENPLVFNHFSYFNSQITIDFNRKTRKYVLKSQNYYPSYVEKDWNELAKEWAILYESSDLMLVQYYFQKCVIECICESNKANLAYKFDQIKAENYPRQVEIIRTMFQ